MRKHGAFKYIRRACFAAALAVLCLTPAPSAAQAPPKSDETDNERAQRIFNEAVAALDENKTDIACPKLEEVIRLRPDGGGARFTLAECYEKAGRLASAWGQYVAAEAMATKAKNAERAKETAAKVAELRPRLATLILEGPDTVSKTPGLVIAVDEKPVVAADLRAPIPVDKGPHTIVVSAPGRKAWTGKVDIAKDGDKMSLSVPPLEIAPIEESTSASPSTPAPTVTPDEPRSKVPAFVMGAVGIAGLIAGGALVGVASSQQDQLFKDAPLSDKGEPLCGPVAVTGEHPGCPGIRSRAGQVAVLGNAGIGVLIGGGVLVAAGVVYLLIPPKRVSGAKSATVLPVIGRDGGGLICSGSF